MSRNPDFFDTLPERVHAILMSPAARKSGRSASAKSAKLKLVLNLSAETLAKVEANLPARRSAQCVGGRGLIYGG
jgi:hypothetical protein